jgi:hypothetical protein
MSAEDDERTLWGADFKDLLLLQQSVAKRLSSFVYEAGNLAASGSIEPRTWVREYAGLWSGVISDFGDWVRVGTGQELRPGDEWVSRARGELNLGAPSLSIRFEVPPEAFGDESEIHLMTDGFHSPAGDLVLREGLRKNGGHVRIAPRKVKPETRRRPELKLYALDADPAHALAEGAYLALISAQETGSPVAVVELVVRRT